MSTPITFLSDYGLDDDFVGVCHAVMSGIAPDSRIVDLSHGVPRHDGVTTGLHDNAGGFCGEADLRQ